MQACRDAGVTAEMDHQHRSLKSQFKLADKVGSHMVAVLGPDELAQGKARVRNMTTHAERLVDIAAASACSHNWRQLGRWRGCSRFHRRAFRC